jgi:hypothetical protein
MYIYTGLASVLEGTGIKCISSDAVVGISTQLRVEL